MKNLPKYFKIALITILILNVNIAPFIQSQVQAAPANFVIPTISNAKLPTTDEYTLSQDTYDLNTPNQNITFTSSQTGFSLSGNTLADISGISFRINYPDQTSSQLFQIEREEDAVDATITQLYTFSKTVTSVDIYYSGSKTFQVSKYPVSTQNIAIQSASDSQKSAYEKLLMQKMGINIITRDEWGAPVSESTIFKTANVNRIVIHHSAGSVNMANPKITVKAIYDNHVSRADIGYDIGYNFLIDPYGNIYQGRSGPFRTVGAHAIPNTGSIGIDLMGNFQTTIPTQEALNSLIKLSAGLSELYGIDLTLNRDFNTGVQSGMMGHRDVILLSCPINNPSCTPAQQYYDTNRTSCPGNSFEAILGTVRDYTNQLRAQNSEMKAAFAKMLTLTNRSNLINNNGFVEVVLNTSQLNPALDPRLKDSYTNGRFGINIKNEKGNLLLIEVDQSQYQQYISEFLLTNPEAKIQPNYKYENAVISTDDTYKGLQWALDNTGQTITVGGSPVTGTNDADIDAPEAWAQSEGTAN